MFAFYWRSSSFEAKPLGKKIYLVLGIIIGLICMFLAFRKIQWAQLPPIFRNANYFELSIAIFFQLLSLAIAGFRWKTVINLPEISWASASASITVGLMVNNILPGRMGEFVRPILLGQETKKSKAFLFATTIVDRILDLTVLVILGLLSFGMFPSIVWGRKISIVGGLVLISGFFLIGIISYSNVGSKIEEMVSQYEKVVHFVQKIRVGLRSISSIQQGGIVFSLSCFVWGAWFLSLYYALNAFALVLPFWGMILLLSVLNLSGLIPSSPGYAGTYHLLIILVLSNFAIKKEEALGFALAFHALWYIPQTFLGMIILLRKHLSLWKLLEAS